MSDSDDRRLIEKAKRSERRFGDGRGLLTQAEVHELADLADAALNREAAKDAELERLREALDQIARDDGRSDVRRFARDLLRGPSGDAENKERQ